MTQVNLHKLLGRRSRLSAALAPFLQSLGPDLSIRDAGGDWLAGAQAERSVEVDRWPVLLPEQTIGWVSGSGPPERLAALAELLSYAAGQEAEKRSLATEVLDRYRELNLLYTLSEKLAANPQPAAMAATALDQAGRLIPSPAGMVFMLCGDSRHPEQMATTGDADRLCAAEVSANLLARVMASGQPELENGVPFSGVSRDDCGSLSLLCAPLKTESHVLGALLLAREAPQDFAAGDLKLLNSVALQAAPVLELARLHQMAVEKARIDRELQMARQVQAGLIPDRMPRLPGWQFAADWRPALEVAGDYFDLIPDADGRWSLVIADVADKGMPASLFMVSTRSVLRALVDQAPSPAATLARANQLLSAEARDGLFVTLFFARLDPDSGELTYVNAGHNPPLLVRHGSRMVTPLVRTGVALGLMDNAWYDQVTVHLEPGDLVLFYTDGVTEAWDGRGEQFGTDRLTELVCGHQEDDVADLLRAIEAAVDDFAGETPQFDDVTLLALKRL